MTFQYFDLFTALDHSKFIMVDNNKMEIHMKVRLILVMLMCMARSAWSTESGVDTKKREELVNQIISIIQDRSDQDKEGRVRWFYEGNLREMNSIISRQTKIDAKGNQLIHYICYYKLAGLVDDFIKVGKNIDAQNNDGITPLMIVSQNGYWEPFEKLILHNPSLDLLDNDKQTALTYATRTSKSGAVGVGIGLATLPVGAVAASTLGAVEWIGGGVLSNVAVRAATMGAFSGSSVAMRGLVLPNKSCDHAFYCDHSRIREVLLKAGADPKYRCSKALGLIHRTCNGLFAPSRKLGVALRSLNRGDNAHMPEDVTYLSRTAAKHGIERGELRTLIKEVRDDCRKNR